MNAMLVSGEEAWPCNVFFRCVVTFLLKFSFIRMVRRSFWNHYILNDRYPGIHSTRWIFPTQNCPPCHACHARTQELNVFHFGPLASEMRWKTNLAFGIRKAEYVFKLGEVDATVWCVFFCMLNSYLGSIPPTQDEGLVYGYIGKFEGFFRDLKFPKLKMLKNIQVVRICILGWGGYCRSQLILLKHCKRDTIHF